MRKLIEHRMTIFFTLSALLFEAFSVWNPFTNSILREMFFSFRAIFYLCLLLYWGVTLSRRISDTAVKYIFYIFMVLIVFCYLTITVKWQVGTKGSIFNKYMWYSSYLPLVLLPAVGIYMYTKPLYKGKWYSLSIHIVFIISLLLAILVLTNDLHSLAFRITDYQNEEYTYGPIFYIIHVYGCSIVFICFSTGIIDSVRLGTYSKKTLAPILVFTLLIAYMFIYLSGASSKGPVFFMKNYILGYSVFAIGIVHSSGYAGFIQFNEEHSKVFSQSKDKMVILDKNGCVVYQTKSLVQYSYVEHKDSTIVDNVRISKKQIRGGYVVYEENIGEIICLNSKIEKKQKELFLRIDELKANKRKEEEVARIRYSNELYTKVEESIHTLLSEIEELTQQITDGHDPKLFDVQIKMIAAKRKSNFAAFYDSTTLASIQDLAFALDELGEYYTKIHVVISKSLDCTMITVFDNLKIYDIYYETIDFLVKKGAKHIYVSIKQGYRMVFISDILEEFELPNATMYFEEDSLHIVYEWEANV